MFDNSRNTSHLLFRNAHVLLERILLIISNISFLDAISNPKNAKERRKALFFVAGWVVRNSTKKVLSIFELI